MEVRREDMMGQCVGQNVTGVAWRLPCLLLAPVLEQQEWKEGPCTETGPSEPPPVQGRRRSGAREEIVTSYKE